MKTQKKQNCNHLQILTFLENSNRQTVIRDLETVNCVALLLPMSIIRQSPGSIANAQIWLPPSYRLIVSIRG